jgi:putative phosphoribosyl transferase
MFADRREAGQLLAKKIKKEITDAQANLVVLGIPRGGIVVAKEVTTLLSCPLDVVITKKIPAPMQSELAIGATGETEGSVYLNQELIADLSIDDKYLKPQIETLKTKIKNREKRFRQEKSAPSLKDKTVIIVDDGAATGATVIAAAREAWNSKPRKVIIALPVLAKDTLQKLEKEADKVIFLQAPKMFFAVGQFYKIFSQVSDETVTKILSKQ